MDIQNHNREAWNKAVASGNPYTVPVSSDVVHAARRGEWELSLTDSRPVPKEWFPDLRGCEVLCLASGGGQQGPVLVAAGAKVTVFDLSPRQLAMDRFVAQRDGLEIRTVEGDMTDLTVFPDESFDLIVHPISNVFIPDVHPVWREAFRVLRPEGILLAGFMNPAEYIFDIYRLDHDQVLEVKHPLPFSSLSSLTDQERERAFGPGAPLEFSHTFEDQIGGQLQAGFVITGFFEERRQDELIGEYMPSYFATRAVKT